MSAIKKYLDWEYLRGSDNGVGYYNIDYYDLSAPVASITVGSGPAYTAIINADQYSPTAQVSWIRSNGTRFTESVVADGTAQNITNGLLLPGTYTGEVRFVVDINTSGVWYRYYGSTTYVSAKTFYAGTVENPTIDDGGIYAAEKLVTLACDTAGATIKYTIDGSTPSESNGLTYSAAFTVTDDVTVKAFAYKSDWISSQVVSESITIIDNITHTSTGTNDASKINFSWNGVTADSYRIYYATTAGVWSGSTYVNVLDGSATSYELTGVPATTMYFRMAAVRSGTVGNLSTETSATAYDGVISDVSFDVASGTYENAFDVVMSTTTPSAYIRFTLDGTNPTTTSGTLFESGDVLHVDDTTVVKALAYKPGWTAGSVQTATHPHTPTHTPSTPWPWGQTLT